MTEKIFEVSTRFDGYEIEELQQYTEEELFEWGKDFADENDQLCEYFEGETLENLNEELDRFADETFGDSLNRLWPVRNEFYDKNDDNDTEEAEEAQTIFDRGVLARYEEVLKSVIQKKEDETDAFFEAARETLVNFWRGKILDEFRDKGIDQEQIDPLGEGIEQSILPDVLDGASVSEAVQDWVDWKKRDLEEREEEDA